VIAIRIVPITRIPQAMLREVANVGACWGHRPGQAPGGHVGCFRRWRDGKAPAQERVRGRRAAAGQQLLMLLIARVEKARQARLQDADCPVDEHPPADGAFIVLSCSAASRGSAMLRPFGRESSPGPGLRAEERDNYTITSAGVLSGRPTA
jgi:hypothetical protein